MAAEIISEPKKVARLSESVMAAIVPDGRDTLIPDALCPGHFVRVTPSGSLIFIARTRCNGVPTKVSIGRWPAMSVVEARKEARVILDALRNGDNPALAKAERARTKAVGAATVEEVGKKWLLEHVEAKRKAITIREYRRVVTKKINPTFGAKPIGSVTKGQVMSWHAGMASTPREANLCLSILKALMNFAEDHNFRPVGSNPARRIERFPENKRERFLTEAEFAAAAAAIADGEAQGHIGIHAAAGLRLALLTGARSSEITGAKWSDVDLPKARIRLKDSKVSATTIHLNAAAVEILKALPRVGRFVIAGGRKDGSFGQLGAAWERVRGRAGLNDVRCHDLRHSFASMAIASGFSLPMVGELLSHKMPSTTKRYAHLASDAANAASHEIGAAIDAAMRKAKPTGANVVEMKKARRR